MKLVFPASSESGEIPLSDEAMGKARVKRRSSKASSRADKGPKSVDSDPESECERERRYGCVNGNKNLASQIPSPSPLAREFNRN